MKGIRTEHAGAKNGHGYWGRRVEAKELSQKERRRVDNRLVESEIRALDFEGNVLAYREWSDE